MAQSLFGTTGLVTVPTARMQEDGTLSFGVSYFDKKNQQYFEGTKNLGVAYINFTFLPFIELVMRVNKALYYSADNYTVDRFPLIKIRLIKEREYWPAIAIGAHDFGSTSDWKTVHFNATYIVLSKKYHDFDLHLGYAPRIVKALYYQLDGPFGGIAYTPDKSIHLYAEYDTRYINAGLQYQFLKHFAVNLAAINFNSFSGGINYKVFL
jgi:hypothetical protein